jgi:hypothetical protein
MSTGVLSGRFEDVSPRARARVTGVVYLLFFLTAILGALGAPPNPLIAGATSDATATARDVLAHETAIRAGWALGLFSTACYVALMALFYQLFRPVSQNVAVLAAFFGLVGCAITAVGSLFQLAPLVVLGGSPYLRVFGGDQRQALALLLLNLGGSVGDIALVFFGLFQLALGSLIYRSTFLPRILAAPIVLAGLGWLLFLWPPLAHALLAPLEILGVVAELALMLWLLIMGVNTQRWEEQAAASAAASRRA